MSYKGGINPGTRTFYVSEVGDDIASGLSPETAVQTMAQAITLVAALVPPSSPTNISSIQIIGAGIFNESNLVFEAGLSSKVGF